MDDPQIEAIAERVAGKLRDDHVIPASLPADVGEAIRRGNHGRNMQWLHSIPLAGADAILTEWTLMADGGLHLRLKDSSGQDFWQGTLRPVKDEGASDG